MNAMKWKMAIERLFYFLCAKKSELKPARALHNVEKSSSRVSKSERVFLQGRESRSLTEATLLVANVRVSMRFYKASK